MNSSRSFGLRSLGYRPEVSGVHSDNDKGQKGVPELLCLFATELLRDTSDGSTW